MLCPFCLKEDTIKKIEERGGSYYVCSEHPEPKIPITYAENEKIPRDVISAIGFRGHGKSAYFASLFSSLDDLARVWPGFCTFPINEQSLDMVHNNVKLLKGGKLPGATPMNFPIPTIVQFSDMPKFKDRFLIFYDTSGESYERASRLINNASFVKRSQTAIFFMSLYDLEYNTYEMGRLLAVYIQGLTELGGDPKQQHLLVVLTKGDLLASKLESHTQIWDYLVHGDVKNVGYSDIKSQIAEMKKVSKLLKGFLKDDIGASNFVALAEKNFRSVETCIISALGAAPKGDQLDISSTPKRIFDPILWVMNNSTGWRHFFFKLTKSSSIFVTSKIKDQNTRTSNIKIPVAKTNAAEKKKIAKYSAITLILVAVIYVVFFSHIQIPNPLPQIASSVFSIIPATPIPTTTTPNNQIAAKMLPKGYYNQINEYLQQGKTNTYYFDIDNPEKIKIIKIWSDAQTSNKINLAVGFGYAPTFDKSGYDYISDSISSQVVVDITNPKQGRYFVTVKGEKGSGDIRIQWETF